MTRREALVLIRNVRLVPVRDRPATEGLVDLELSGDRIASVRPASSRRRRSSEREREQAAGDAAAERLDAEGRWAIPGLWDQHVHLGQWALNALRLDTSGTTSAAEVLSRVTRRLTDGTPLPPTGLLVGFGHRSAMWAEPPTVAALDAVAGEVPVALISGDAHHGWLDSAALRLLGLPPRNDVLAEDEWFPVFDRLAALPGATAEVAAGYRTVVARAAAMGIVGVVDLEWGDGFRAWPARVADGIDALRIRVGVYPDLVEETIAAGLRTGDALPGAGGIATMGPLKVIGDGSLNTRTAYCSSPYADAATGAGERVNEVASTRGARNYGPDALVAIVRRAHVSGLAVALHAIGDAAIDDALDAFEATGARGSVEHAQLLRPDQVARFARLGVAASVQPAHLLDDRDVAERLWPDRTAWCYPFGDLVRAGVDLRLGSDAPVSPLDPWLAMAAAVHRSADERPAWHPEQALTAPQALAASTDGGATLAAGCLADLALIDDDPLADTEGSPGRSDTAAVASRLRGIRVAATVVGGRVTHLAL